MNVQYVREALIYNKKTGILIWNTRPRSHFDSDRAHNILNGKLAGTEAGTTVNHRGKDYKSLGLDGKRHQAHRIIYLLMTGSWPTEDIDHIDGNGLNNSWCNLREVSHQENQKNMKLPAHNTSGTIGVYWNKRSMRWLASIGISGKQKYIGVFSDYDQAVVARKQAEIDNGFHINHGQDRPL